MHIHTTIILSVVLTTAFAFPSPPKSEPGVVHSQKFKLRSRLLTAPKAFSNLFIEPYHVSPAINYATLYPKTAQTQGIVGYLNGTEKDLKEDNGDLVFPLEQGFSESWIVHGDASTWPVQISVGEGTKGIFTEQGILKYKNPLSGGWYACNNTLLYGPAMQVFWKVKVYDTPKGCEDVELEVVKV